jgi:hypothetical protein
LFVAGLLHRLRHMPALVSFRGWQGLEKKKDRPPESADHILRRSARPDAKMY